MDILSVCSLHNHISKFFLQTVKGFKHKIWKELKLFLQVNI